MYYINQKDNSDGRYMENCDTTRQYYFCLMWALKQFVIAIVKSQNWNLPMECDQTLLNPFNDKWKQAMKQRGGVPAYLNLYNIVNWTTTYEPTATLEELISISLFNSVYALRKVSRIVYVFFLHKYNLQLFINILWYISFHYVQNTYDRVYRYY